MIVVSNTSPILNLARIDSLELLPLLFGEVLIPDTVYAELVRNLTGISSNLDLASLPWLLIVAVDPSEAEKFRPDLDPGEAAAIVLAIERKADFLLVDERRGRRVAIQAGLNVTGLLGVLAKAKSRRLIDRGKPVLDRLMKEARFWFAPELYAQFLADLGED